MSEQALEQPTNPQDGQPMPPPPSDDLDPDVLELADERWQECPLRDCKRKPELLYEEFYLRDIRTNRAMCSACVIRTEIGYQARDVVRKHDDRFFQATVLDDFVTLVITIGMALIVNMLLLFLPFWYFAILIGGAAGAVIGQAARWVTGKRVGRTSQYIAVAGVIIACGIALMLSLVFRIGFGRISVLIGTVGMASAIWGIFLRRI